MFNVHIFKMWGDSESVQWMVKTSSSDLSFRPQLSESILCQPFSRSLGWAFNRCIAVWPALTFSQMITHSGVSVRASTMWWARARGGRCGARADVYQPAGAGSRGIDDVAPQERLGTER